MTIKELKTAVINNPDKDVPKGTSRFCYRDRTLWYKNGRTLYPMFSHRHSFVISWPEGPTGEKTRTERDYDILSEVCRKWVSDISEGGRRPCVQIHCWQLPNTAQYIIDPIIAQIGEVNASVAEQNRRDASWQRTFEEVIRRFAYQTIKKENATKELIRLIGQLENDVSVESKKFAELAAPILDRHCAPPSQYTWEDIPAKAKGNPHNGNHLWDLVDQANAIDAKASRLRFLIDQFKDVAKASTARHMELKPEDKQVRYKASENLRGHQCFDDFSRTFETSGDGALEVQRWNTTTLIDWSSQSYSYYWVKDHIQYYLDCLRAVGIPTGLPFGLQPEEWRYEELAAPLLI